MLIGLMVLGACGKPSAAGKYSVDIINETAKAGLPGADKIILSLTDDGKASLDAGPLNMLSTTWKQDGEKVTFGQGQGMIGMEYKVVEGNLVPQENGKDSTSWRFKKQ